MLDLVRDRVLDLELSLLLLTCENRSPFADATKVKALDAEDAPNLAKR